MEELDYLDKRVTTFVNGIFILIVFLSHTKTYMEVPVFVREFTKAFGQLMVAPFLFYSGYGVGISIRKKGMDYVRSIPVRRVGTIMLRFIPAVLLYLPVDFFCGIRITPYKFVFSLLAWENLGNSNWYIFVILWLYLITWASFMAAFFVSDKRKALLISMTVLTGAFYLFLHQMRENYWYNTMSAYFFGMLVAATKEKWDVWLSHSALVYVIAGGSLAATLLLRPYRSHATVFLLMSVTFCTLILCLTKVGCKMIKEGKHSLFILLCRGFEWLGSHLFEIYILMRIPMMVLEKILLPHLSDYWLFAAISFSITLVFAQIYHRFFSAFAASRFAR